MLKKNIGYIDSPGHITNSVFSKWVEKEDIVEFVSVRTSPYIENTTDYFSWIEIPLGAEKVELKIGDVAKSWEFPALSSREKSLNYGRLLDPWYKDYEKALPARYIVFEKDFITFDNRANATIRFFSPRGEIFAGARACCGFFRNTLKKDISSQKRKCIAKVVTRRFSPTGIEQECSSESYVVVSSPEGSRFSKESS